MRSGWYLLTQKSLLTDRQTGRQAGKGSIAVTSFLSLFAPEAFTTDTLHTLLWLFQLVLGRMAAAFHLTDAGSLGAPGECDSQAFSDILQRIY